MFFMDLNAGDLLDLAAILGSLQLLPQNADFTTVLEAATARVICEPTRVWKELTSLEQLRESAQGVRICPEAFP